MNIAVYSGSFDPIHKGHEALAHYIVSGSFGKIDKVLLLVTPHNPLKPDASAASFSDRIKMCELAFTDTPAIEPSDFEASLPSPHFTYNTLRALQLEHPRHKFSLLIGSDNWLIFDQWRDYDKIISEFGLLIYPRPGYPVDTASLPAGVTFLTEAPTTRLASTEIRQAIADNRPTNHMLPEGVYSYILTHNLYGRKHD